MDEDLVGLWNSAAESGGGIGVARAWWATHQGMREPIRAGHCVSCDSSRIVAVGLDAYRCDDCGYWGGAGAQAAYRAANQGTVKPAGVVDQIGADLVQIRRMLIGLGTDSSGGSDTEAADHLAAAVQAVIVPSSDDGDLAQRFTFDEVVARVGNVWARLGKPVSDVEQVVAPRGVMERILFTFGMGRTRRIRRLQRFVDAAIAQRASDTARFDMPRL